MTTIDVEQCIVEEKAAANEQDETSGDSGTAWGRPGVEATSVARLLRNLLQLLQVISHGVLVGHLDGGSRGWQSAAQPRESRIVGGIEIECCMGREW